MEPGQPRPRDQLLQLHVLGLGLLQDGDVRVGVFPQREEILIRGAGFGGVAGHRVGAGQAEAGELFTSVVPRSRAAQ